MLEVSVLWLFQLPVPHLVLEMRHGARKETPMKTIFDVLLLIHQMRTCSIEELQKHAQTLIGRRTRGSITDFGVDHLPADRKLVEFTHCILPEVTIPGCRYFSLYASELNPVALAIPYREVREIDRDDIKRRPSPHEPKEDELYFDRPLAEVAGEPTDYLTIILGPPGGYPGFTNGVIWTWHPGMPLATLPKGEAPNEYTAVKLHAE